MDRIAVHTDHFHSRGQVFDELELNGLHIMEMDVPAVDNEPHWHRFSTWLYVLEGELTITDATLERSFTAGPGARVDVPERVVHSERSAGYRIIAGLSELPDDLAEVDLPPDRL